MKKYQLILPMLLLFSLSPVTHALDGRGTIEEIVNCSRSGRWRNILLFRLSDNKWFGIYANYYVSKATDYDNNFSTSMVLMAFSANLPVQVRARSNKKVVTYCGVTVSMFHSKTNDYIKISK